MIGDKGRFALVRPAGSQTVTTLAQGEEIGGWRVFLILPDRIVLRAGATEAEVAAAGFAAVVGAGGMVYGISLSTGPYAHTYSQSQPGSCFEGLMPR